MIEAYVTNLGKYNEGELCGEYLKLPATKEDVQALLSRIGVDGVLYEEFFITDYETDLAGMQNLGEYESIDELNYLAALLDEMPDSERDKFEAAAVYGDHSGSIKDLINLSQNLDCYEIYPGVHDNDDLGRYLIEELECMDIPDWIENYFDYDGYGRDFSINEGGEFTDSGYIYHNGDSFIEYYDGRNVPDEYRIFAYPDTEKMNMRDRLNMYQQMTSSLPTADKSAPKREELT